MIITNELLEKIEKMPCEEVELATISKESSEIAEKFRTELLENFRFKAGEDKILIASEKIINKNICENDLKIYYTYSGQLLIKNGDELYFQVSLNEFDTLYYCLFARVLSDNSKYEFDKKVSKMYYDKKLARIGNIIYDIYNVFIKAKK